MRTSSGWKQLLFVLAGTIGALLAAPTWAAYQGPAELVFVETGEAASLDPLRDLTVAAAGINVHVFDQLVDYEGPTLKLVPKLALSWDNPSPVQWRFRLRLNSQRKMSNGHSRLREIRSPSGRRM